MDTPCFERTAYSELKFHLIRLGQDTGVSVYAVAVELRRPRSRFGVNVMRLSIRGITHAFERIIFYISMC